MRHSTYSAARAAQFKSCDTLGKRVFDTIGKIACIAVGGYLALIGATASWPWIEGIIMGVAP